MTRPAESRIAIWIDEKHDFGNGLFEEIYPDMFGVSDEGVDCIRQPDGTIKALGFADLRLVKPEHEHMAIDAAETAAEKGLNMGIYVCYVAVDPQENIVGVYDFSSYDQSLALAV